MLGQDPGQSSLIEVIFEVYNAEVELCYSFQIKNELICCRDSQQVGLFTLLLRECWQNQTVGAPYP